MRTGLLALQARGFHSGVDLFFRHRVNPGGFQCEGNGEQSIPRCALSGLADRNSTNVFDLGALLWRQGAQSLDQGLVGHARGVYLVLLSANGLTRCNQPPLPCKRANRRGHDQ